jgi:similar to stage IV sporulation protein
MERHLADFWRGYVQVRINGCHYDRFLNLCAYHGIRLWEIRPEKEDYTAYVTGRDFKKLKSIVRKSQASVVITQRHGLPFFIHRNRKRKASVMGLFAAFLFMVWLSAHVWKISIDGNLSQTDDVIFEYLDQEGIYHGMWKSQVDCKLLAADIRNYFTQFAWVAAELKGTRLVIHVKEGILSEEEDADSDSGDAGEWEVPSSLAATCSGIVESIYVRKGRPLVQAGDEVEKGEVLVSGALPIYNDESEVASWQYVAADADIVIRRTRSYRDEVALAAEQKVYTGREKSRYLLRIGNLPFALPDFGNDYEQSDTVSYLTQLQVSENFYLPVYIQKFTVREYEKQEILYTEEESREILSADFQYFVENLEEKGVQIFENNVKIEWNEKSAIASGVLTTGENAVSRIQTDSMEEEIQRNEFS